MRNVRRVTRLALALESVEASDNLERVLKHAQMITVDECVGIRTGIAAARAARDVVVEQAALRLGADHPVGVARREQHGEILRGGREQRVLKVYYPDAAVLHEKVLPVVVAMRQHARKTAEPRREIVELRSERG